jgi:hypothetical protein
VEYARSVNSRHADGTEALFDPFLLGGLYVTVLILITVNALLIPTGGDTSGLSPIIGSFARQLDLAREGNFATWISSAMLLFNAMHAYALVRRYGMANLRIAGTYGLLAMGFLFLSVDDFAQIHERMEGDLRLLAREVELGGSLTHLGAMFALALAALLVVLVRGPLLRSIRKGSLRLLIGTIGLVVVCAAAEYVYNLTGPDHPDWGTRLEVAVEEGGELLAILLFLTFLHRQRTMPAEE